MHIGLRSIDVEETEYFKKLALEILEINQSIKHVQIFHVEIP